jgi:hypothetical protein
MIGSAAFKQLLGEGKQTGPRLSQPLGCMSRRGQPPPPAGCTTDWDAVEWMRHEFTKAPILVYQKEEVVYRGSDAVYQRVAKSAFEAATGMSRERWVYTNDEDMDRIPMDDVPLLHHVLSQEGLVPRNGLWLEFGVFRGYSLAVVSRAAPRSKPVYGFDSFLGLPDTWDGLPAGFFSLGGWRPPVPPNAVLVAGWYNETLLPFLKEHDEQVSFVHLDCNLFESVAEVLAQLAPRLAPGAVLLFDEIAHAGAGTPKHRVNFRAVYDLMLEGRLPPVEWIGRGEPFKEGAVRVLRGS